MDCPTCQSLLAEYSLGHLADEERDRVSRHLAGCGACRAVLRETEEAWVALADSLPPAAVPPHIEIELRQRIAKERGTRAAVGTAAPPRAPLPAFTPERDELELASGRSLSRRHLAIAASVFLAFTVALLSWLTYRQHQWEVQQAELDRQAREMERLRAELSAANELFNMGRLHFASLREAGPQAAVRGYVVWDRLSRQVHFYAFDLPPVAEDRVWRIWLLSEGQEPVAAGTLEPQPDRTGRAVVDVPAELEDAFRLALVEEPSVAPPAPSREPWLTADIE